MSNRTLSNHPYNDEKFTHRRKSGKTPRKKQPTFREMVRRAHQRIIGATHKRGNGFIPATCLNDAVATLKRWVKNTDGKIGRHHQVYDVLKKAFRELFAAEVFTRWQTGYKLNPHVALPSAA